MQKFNSPLEAFLYWESNTPDYIFFNQPLANKTITYTYKEAGLEARKIASALKEMGFISGDHIALMSKNCAHWIMSDLAIMMADCISIPVYPTLNAETIKLILDHSESKGILIGKLDNYESQKLGIPDIPKISVSLYGVNDGMIWEDLLEKSVPMEEMPLKKSEDLHTIIYTSGTTGRPKGVMHTVGNFMESTHVFPNLFKISEHLRMFSYLPLAHVAERLIINTGISLGAKIYFTHSLETFAKDLENAQPHMFFAVPRIWTKFREKILESIPQKKLKTLLKIPILNSIIKNKLQKKLGLKEARFICSAAAPLSSDIIIWFKKLGLIICQGYGMTEDGCVSHFNLPDANRIGTVGKTVPGAKIKLSPEGEICIKNNCLMKGYYKEPEMTASVFDDEGYLKTGDMGELDHDGYLTITGRIKDQFKTDKGKYISPSYMELLASKNTNIEQICIVGTGIPQPIALVTLSGLGEALSKDELCTSLMNTVRNINEQVEKHEKLEKVVVMKEDWNVDNGLTTASLKIKRNAIERIHQPYYKQWFEDSDKVIFE